MHNFLCIGAGQPEHQAFHGLALTALRHHAVAREIALAHLGNVGNAHARAALGLDDDGAQILHGPDAAFAAHQQHFIAFTQTASAVIAVVFLDGFPQLRGGQAHRGELHWVGNDLERAHLAAQRIDIRHARHRTQGGPDHPVEQATSLLQRHLFGLDGEHEHFAERRRDRRHATADAARQIGTDVGQPFSHLLTCPIDVGGVLKIDRDVDDAVLGHRAQDALVGNAQHLDFDRYGDASFDLLGRHARCFHDDLDLRARYVGKRIDRQVAEGIPARTGQQGAGQQDEQALRERELNETGQHVIHPSRRRPCRARLLSGRSRT